MKAPVVETRVKAVMESAGERMAKTRVEAKVEARVKPVMAKMAKAMVAKSAVETRVKSAMTETAKTMVAKPAVEARTKSVVEPSAKAVMTEVPMRGPASEVLPVGWLVENEHAQAHNSQSSR